MTTPDRSVIDGKADTDIYLNFVDSLFTDRRSLLTGLTLQVAVAICVFIESQMAIMGVWPGLFLLASSYRLFHVRTYQKERQYMENMVPADRVPWARNWERRYIFSAGAVGLAVGLFAWFCFELIGSHFAVIASLSLVFAALPTIVGRLYGSVRLAAIMTVVTLAAPAVSLIQRWELASTILVLLLVPYIGLVLTMVRKVRSTVVSAVRGQLETDELASRLDVALSNMSHGVIMFDEDQQILVMNRRARVLLQIPRHIQIEGRSFNVLMRYATRYQLVPKAEAQAFVETLTHLLTRQAEKAQIKLASGSRIEFSGTRRPEGGSVLILEDVTERIRAQEKIKAMARYDALTDLPNRNHFAELVHNAITQSSPDQRCLVIAFDVDDFKRVNDSIGHAQGDSLLRAIARRLKARFEDRAIISRLGGDEFILFVPNLPDGTTPSVLAEELSQSLAKAFRIGPEQVLVTQSFGVTEMRAGAFDLKRAMVQADLALYHSKAIGRGVWSIFETDMNERYLRRQLLKSELAKAVDDHALTVRYQPIVDAGTGRMVACEALSRWHHATYGAIPPSEFIPLAEEMGMIGKITALVLNQAARDCVQWPDHIRVSVNLSPIDFQRDGISDVIRSALDEAGLAAGRLEVEITETAVIKNEKDMVDRLERIRGTGVSIALDDFGTGYSSLSYLHRLPLQRVKIDRSFVTGLETGETPLALLQGIADLCHGLGLSMTVEGVETARQLSLIRQSGKIDRIQGYLFGPALPASAIGEMATRMPPEKNAASEPVVEPDSVAG